ncbi:MAG: hypothetical protein WC483_00645 [Candidatus Paceibacterota bacterium]
MSFPSTRIRRLRDGVVLTTPRFAIFLLAVQMTSMTAAAPLPSDGATSFLPTARRQTLYPIESNRPRWACSTSALSSCLSSAARAICASIPDRATWRRPPRDLFTK